MHKLTLHQRNQAKAKFNRAAAPVLDEISHRIMQQADERFGRIQRLLRATRVGIITTQELVSNL